MTTRDKMLAQMTKMLAQMLARETKMLAQMLAQMLIVKNKSVQFV